MFAEWWRMYHFCLVIQFDILSKRVRDENYEYFHSFYGRDVLPVFTGLGPFTFFRHKNWYSGPAAIALATQIYFLLCRRSGFRARVDRVPDSTLETGRCTAEQQRNPFSENVLSKSLVG